MKLRFNESQIQDIANRYYYPREEGELIQIRKQVEKQGYLSKNQLKLVAKWKATRSAGHVEKNSEDYVKEVTAFVSDTSCSQKNSQKFRSIELK